MNQIEQIYQYQNDWDECEWEGLGIEDDLISRRAMYIALNDLGDCKVQAVRYGCHFSGQRSDTMEPEGWR